MRSGGYGRVIAEFRRKARRTFLSSFALRGGGSNHHLGDDSVMRLSVSSMSCMDLTRGNRGNGPNARRRKGSGATVKKTVSVRVPMGLEQAER